MLHTILPKNRLYYYSLKSHSESRVLLKPVGEGIHMNRVSQSETAIFVFLATKGCNFSERTYISIDLKGPSFPNSFTGYKLVRQFSIGFEIARHIWIPQRLSGTFCFLLRLPSTKINFHFYWTVVSAGSRFTQKPKQTASHGRKIIGLVYTLRHLSCAG